MIVCISFLWLGGPSLGDIRSRLVRLIPKSSNQALKKLLEHRLPSGSVGQKEIKSEWIEILEGRHKLWKGIEREKREIVRRFLGEMSCQKESGFQGAKLTFSVQFESEILIRSQKDFDFRNGSIGNFFLSSCQMFFRSVSY
jgi:hypothetical protein